MSEILASLAMLNNFFRIMQGSQPVEPRAKSFPHDCPGSYMITAFTRMNLVEDVNTFHSGDRLHENSIASAMLIQGLTNHGVKLAAPNNLPSLYLLLGQLVVLDVVNQRLRPCHVDFHDRETSDGVVWINRIRDRWLGQLIDEGVVGNFSSGRSELGKYIYGDVVFSFNMMELEPKEVLFELADFYVVGIHILLGSVPVFVDLLDDDHRISIDQQALDAERNNDSQAMK